MQRMWEPTYFDRGRESASCSDELASTSGAFSSKFGGGHRSGRGGAQVTRSNMFDTQKNTYILKVLDVNVHV